VLSNLVSFSRVFKNGTWIFSHDRDKDALVGNLFETSIYSKIVTVLRIFESRMKKFTAKKNKTNMEHTNSHQEIHSRIRDGIATRLKIAKKTSKPDQRR
jgi:hypothetical protein